MMLAAAAGPVLDWATGDATCLPIPAHAQALLAGGAGWLTKAFRRFGALAADNAVTRIAGCQPCPGGSTGSKLFLTLEYERDEPGLERELFVKFSRDFEDARRDRQRTEMASEARFAALTRLPGFPIEVPHALFADYHGGSGTGLLVSQRILFGEDGIEPHRRKCMDHRTLPQPLPYYQAVITALARLAAAHHSGRLAPDIDAQFPFDPATGSADPITFGKGELEAQLASGRAFADSCPQLLAPELRTPAFQARMERDALRILAEEERIQRWLAGNPALIALDHWNAHIDNCFFRRDAAGTLRCGLLDWGRVNQMTLGGTLWGCLSAAHHAITDEHLDDLLALFVEVYVGEGGPVITVAELKLHFLVHVATMGVSRCLIAPETILFRLPEAPDAAGPFDPMFAGNDPARNWLHTYTVLLKLWHREDFGAALDRVL